MEESLLSELVICPEGTNPSGMSQAPPPFVNHAMIRC